MSFIVPNQGEVQLLKDVLGSGGTAGVITLEAWTLKLFKVDKTPAEGDSAADYTVCDFGGYVDKTLTRDTQAGHWSVPASVAPTDGWASDGSVAEATYAAQSWTATTSQTVYGYIIVGATSGVLIHAVKFTTAITVGVGVPISVTPRFGAA